MQTRNISRLGDWNQTNYNASGAVTGTSSGTSPHITDTFTFTGFGSNDRRRKRNPTAGEYTLEYSRGHYGMTISQSINYGSKGNVAVRNGALSSIGGGQLLGTGYSTPTYSNAVYNNTLTKLYDKIRASDLNLAVSLGEMRETKRMIDSAVRSIGELTTLARRVKRRLLTDPSKLFSELWLSYKYGWLPLYTDVYNLLNFTTRHFDEVEFKARSGRREEIRDSTGLANSLNGLSLVTGYRQWKCEASVTVSVADSLAFDRSRITSLNPLVIAWELVPLSFVVDWFYDVGGYLAAQEAALGAGLAFKRGYITEVAYQNARELLIVENFLDGVYPSQILRNRNSQAYRVGARKRRTVLSGFPRPNSPTLKISLGSQRIISAAALFRTVVLGRA